ncbi:hypothetical protein F5Y13DRAFT_107338 [Hypoxylon sp. FL1857]|nr:hypothetical protein F5Y13DRAFT_107338 [Hypoxylon sp. FL1857]
MRSVPVLAVTAALAVAQTEYNSADLNVRPISLTSTDIPTLTPPPSSTTTESITWTGGVSESITSSSAPTGSTSQFPNATAGGNDTQTLSGVRPSATLASSLIQSLSASSSPNAAAMPAEVGVGLLAGMLGVVAVL